LQGEVKRQETRVMGLLCGEGCVILTSTVFDWSTRVTDRRTDGRTDGRAIAYMLSRAKNTEMHTRVNRHFDVCLYRSISIRHTMLCTSRYFGF